MRERSRKSRLVRMLDMRPRRQARGYTLDRLAELVELGDGKRMSSIERSASCTSVPSFLHIAYHLGGLTCELEGVSTLAVIPLPGGCIPQPASCQTADLRPGEAAWILRAEIEEALEVLGDIQTADHGQAHAQGYPHADQSAAGRGVGGTRSGQTQTRQTPPDTGANRIRTAADGGRGRAVPGSVGERDAPGDLPAQPAGDAVRAVHEAQPGGGAEDPGGRRVRGGAVDRGRSANDGRQDHVCRRECLSGEPCDDRAACRTSARKVEASVAAWRPRGMAIVWPSPS